MYRAQAVYIKTTYGENGMEDVTMVTDTIYGKDTQVLLSKLKGIDTDNNRNGVKLDSLTIEKV